MVGTPISRRPTHNAPPPPPRMAALPTPRHPTSKTPLSCAPPEIAPAVLALVASERLHAAVRLPQPTTAPLPRAALASVPASAPAPFSAAMSLQ